MRVLVGFMFLTFSNTCYAGRGGYTLGHSLFGDFFAIVLYSIWLIYCYYQVITHFDEMKRNSLRDNIPIILALIFWSTPLLIPFLSTTDKKPSPTPSYSSTYEREDWLTTTRSYSPPKSDYRPITERFANRKSISDFKQPLEMPKQQQIHFPASPEVIPVRPVQLTESSPGLQVNSEVVKELLKDTTLFNPPSKESAKDLQERIQIKDDSRSQELKAELEEFHKKWEAELKAEQERLAAELEVQREMLQAEYLNHAQDIFVAGDSRTRFNEIMREVEQDRIRKNQELQRLRNDKIIFGGIR